MKLEKLNIQSYRHLQNLNFDFTYRKSWKPLKKICLIGQSATGKTSILELIKNNISQLGKNEIINGQYFFHHFQLDFDGQLEYINGGKELKVEKDKIKHGEQIFKNFEGNAAGTVGKLLPDGLKMLYLSTEIISRETVNLFNRNPLDILNTISENMSLQLKSKEPLSAYLYELNQDINTEIWYSLLYKILDYRKRYLQMASELLNKGIIGDINKLNRQYIKWSEENVNPLASFAETFKPILDRLNLEIDLVNTEYSVPVKLKTRDEIIPFSDLSTGTKELMLTLFPLYQLDTRDAIILLDEPERSLFPDIQIDLIKYYVKMAPDAQLIVATHSPFVAAAFEPEERFILYFSNDGKVCVRRGESPIGDDPNDILSNDFNVDYYNEFGKKAYQDYLDLKSKVASETEPAKKKELMIEMAELGDKYNF